MALPGESRRVGSCVQIPATMHERIPRAIFISSIARRMPSADVARISHLQRVEAILNHHPAILESANVAMSSGLDEDDVKAVSKVSAEAPWTFGDEQIPRVRVRRYIEFRREMPKTPNQKIHDESLVSRRPGASKFA